MKLQHARLIGKHRTRYSRLQKKYSELEKDFREVEDVGTPQQIVRDSRKFLSEEHSLFMESQMLWKNVEGKGNRFTKRFLHLMLDLYHKSPAGYRYLKSVFTLPSIKFLLKLEGTGIFTGTKRIKPSFGGGDSSKPQTPDGGSSRSADDEETGSNIELPVPPVKIKTEAPSLSEQSDLVVPSDSKDWFKSDMMTSESLPSTSRQNLFLNSSGKNSLEQSKADEEEEEQDGTMQQANSNSSELNETGPSITSFNNLSKKVVVMQDTEPLNKQGFNWDESWDTL